MNNRFLLHTASFVTWDGIPNGRARDALDSIGDSGAEISGESTERSSSEKTEEARLLHAEVALESDGLVLDALADGSDSSLPVERIISIPRRIAKQDAPLARLNWLLTWKVRESNIKM